MSTLVKSRNSFVPFSNLFDEFFKPGYTPQSRAFHKVPAVNVKEDERSYQIDIAAPGLSKEDFNVALENDVLSISAESKKEEEQTETNYTRKEFAYSEFRRTFSLPENKVDVDAVSANYRDGVLSITLPKLEVGTKDAKREIEII